MGDEPAGEGKTPVTTSLVETYLAISGNGSAMLQERGDRWPNGYGYDPKETFLEEEIAEHGLELSLNVDPETPEGACEISIKGYHLLNSKSERAFHARLDLYLQKADLRRLRAFIDFLLEAD